MLSTPSPVLKRPTITSAITPVPFTTGLPEDMAGSITTTLGGLASSLRCKGDNGRWQAKLLQLCPAKIKSAFELNNIKKSDVTMLHAKWLGEINNSPVTSSANSISYACYPFRLSSEDHLQFSRQHDCYHFPNHERDFHHSIEYAPPGCRGEKQL
jgi:hypothetical protein